MPFLLFTATGIFAYAGLKLYKDFKTDFNKSSIEKFRSETFANEIKTTKNNLTISSLSLFLAAIGSVFYLPFLLFASTVGIIYTTIAIWQDSYDSIIKKHELNWSVVESIAFPWLLSSGYHFSTALLNWLSWLSKTFVSEFKILGKDLRRSFFKTFGQLPTTIWLKKDGVELESSINELVVGDIITVNTGEIVAVDGIIIEGNAYINQYLLTGISQPLAKSNNDQIFASNMIISGRLSIKVDKWGTDTAIAKDMSTCNFKDRFYETTF
ncbi:MAG TPA: hypothetical protein ENK59_02285 [Thioploca sp.]|nr:hypothetical protein [Thioploca sp.]